MSNQRGKGVNVKASDYVAASGFKRNENVTDDCPKAQIPLEDIQWARMERYRQSFTEQLRC